MRTDETNHEPEGIDLTWLKFGAKIDYVTVYTDGKCKLPKFDGNRFWARREHFRKLSIHDPSPRDIRLLSLHLGNPRLAELEVAVDIRPAKALSDDERGELIDTMMVQLIAKGLAPRGGKEDLLFGFRGAFQGVAGNFKLFGFNHKLPPSTAQQLHGKRHDPLQVKSYGKRTDQGKQLTASKYVARVEVRMSGYGLESHGLRHAEDLMTFRFRKELMPHFTMTRGAVMRKRPRPSSARRLRNWTMLQLLDSARNTFFERDWDRVGVGAFVGQGKNADLHVRLLRDRELNARIGQALLRLEQRIAPRNSCKTSEQAHEISQC